MGDNRNGMNQRPQGDPRMAAHGQMNRTNPNIRQTPRMNATDRDMAMRQNAAQQKSAAQSSQGQKSGKKKKKSSSKGGYTFSNGFYVFGILLLCIAGVVFYIMKKSDTAATDSTQHGVAIWEVMSSNKGTVPDETGQFPDWIELHNTTNEEINVGGFGLSDDKLGTVKWTIPTGTKIEPDGYLVIYCSGETERGDMHASFRISASDMLTLSTESGTSIEQIQLKAVDAGKSYGVDESGEFNQMEPSPGFPNTAEGQNAYLMTMSASTSDSIGVFLNEFQSSNASTLIGPDGTYCDWIELYNTTGSEVDLSGYGVSDTKTQPLKYVLPEGTTIAAQSCLLIYCDGRETVDAGIIEAPFGLSSYKEDVVFSTPTGKILDVVSYERQETDTSTMRSPDGTGDWSITSQPTPGFPNTEAGLSAYMQTSTYGKGNLIISEVSAVNTKELKQADMTYPDWIEIKNNSSSAINLKDYALSKNAKNPGKWVFPDVTIGPGDYMVVLATGNNVTDTQKKNLETNFTLSADGDKVFLFSPEGEILDKLSFGRVHSDVSYGRSGEQLLYYSTPTPGSANGSGSIGYATMPEFKTAPGIYTSAQAIELKVPSGYTVTYTMDGTEPDENSTKYTGPISISGNTVFRARSFKDGMEPSDIATGTFFIRNGNNTMESHETVFTTISLVTEPDNLFGVKNGIYVAGQDFADRTGEDPTSYTLVNDTSNPEWKYANFNAQHTTHPDPLSLNWERPVHMEIFTPEGELEYGEDLMFRIFGAFSRFKAQKSFAIVARSGYGATSIDDKLFENREFTSYKSFILRNSAMDCFMSKIRDVLIQGLLEDAGTILPVQAYRRAIVYLNGRYWGLYNMREKTNKYFLAQTYKIADPDTIDLLVGNGNSPAANISGDNAYVEYNEFIDWVKSHDLTDPNNYAAIQTKMDVENFAEYCALEIFVGNTDSGNIKFWKSKAYDNKWRWIPYDFDWAFNRNDGSDASVTSGYRRNFFAKYFHEVGHGVNKGFSTVLARALLQNSTFRALFLQKCAFMYNEVFPADKMTARIDELAAEMETEMQYDTERWDGFSIKTWNNSIENLRDSAENSGEYFILYCQEYFNLTDSETIQLFGKVSSKKENG